LPKIKKSMMKKFLFIFLIVIPGLTIFNGCKKYNLKKIQHRWQFIEIPVDTSIEVWSFDEFGKIHWISLNGTSEDTTVSGEYAILSSGRVQIYGFAASYNATWEIVKNNEEVMILNTKDLGGMTTREFFNVD
jgi:hypothetical protein